MSYVPNNISLYNAALSGFISGIYQLGSPVTVTPASSENALDEAQDFAQTVDAFIAPTTVSTDMAIAMFGLCQSSLAQRNPNATSFTQLASSVIAIFTVIVTGVIPGGGGGGGATGPANAVAYYDGSGNNSGSPELTGNQYDAYGRPQIHDYRVGVPSGRGAVYRLGAWGVDGDPQVGVTSEGFICYGANALGDGPDSAQGGFGFYEPNGFGELNVITGSDGGNTFYICGFEDGSPNAPFGLDGFIVNTNLAVALFQVRRTDGVTFIASAQVNRAELSEAANAMQGVATVPDGGSIVVDNTSVDATSRIMLTIQPGVAPTGPVWISNITPGVSFTISCTSDVTVAWQIWHAGP